MLRYLVPVLKREVDYQQFGDWLAEVVNNRGRLYAPEVVDAAVRLIQEKGYQLPT